MGNGRERKEGEGAQARESVPQGHAIPRPYFPPGRWKPSSCSAGMPAASGRRQDTAFIRAFGQADTEKVRAIWNRVVEDGAAFPQAEDLSKEEAEKFFARQACTGIAVEEDSGEIAGMSILHPGSIARAGCAVREGERGHHIGEAREKSCLARAKAYGLRILQFNAAAASNHPAQKRYEKLGFVRLGTIPGEFL